MNKQDWTGFCLEKMILKIQWSDCYVSLIVVVKLVMFI